MAEEEKSETQPTQEETPQKSMSQAFLEETPQRSMTLKEQQATTTNKRLFTQVSQILKADGSSEMSELLDSKLLEDDDLLGDDMIEDSPLLGNMGVQLQSDSKGD